MFERVEFCEALLPKRATYYDLLSQDLTCLATRGWHFPLPLTPRAAGTSKNWRGQASVVVVIMVVRAFRHTANMCSGITVEVHLKNCNFEKLQFFTVDLCSLDVSHVKNSKANTIGMESILP